MSERSHYIYTLKLMHWTYLDKRQPLDFKQSASWLDAMMQFLQYYQLLQLLPVIYVRGLVVSGQEGCVTGKHTF